MALAEGSELAALLNDDAFSIDTFRTNYKRAKACLEKNAGFGDRPPADAAESARRFSKHTRAFVMRPPRAGTPTLPDEAGKRVLACADDVERACDPADPDAIKKATAELAKAAADAIRAVYAASSAARPPRRSR